MKRKLIALAALFLIPCGLISAEVAPEREQSNIVSSVLGTEHTALREGAVDIINWIDQVYGDIQGSLEKDKKIVIFFDPAHGKLPNGKWQGEVTNRMSCTNRPEEYYSILLSRSLYRLLDANRHIEVISTSDFMDVLKGRSDTYKDIPFTKTVALAKKRGAFMIISEHLNNVSIFHKATGNSNISGLHIVHDYRGRKFLKYIYGQYSGFLTLYNKLDPTGFSRQYALALREYLMEEGMNPNSWDKGAVADARFSYFYDFPLSIIYESGFISNPDEEEDLRNPERIDAITASQYSSLLDCLKEVFGVDISGKKPEKIRSMDENILDLIKLSQITVFYIKKGEKGKAIAAIGAMERRFKKTEYWKYISYYSGLKTNLMKSEHCSRLAHANIQYKEKYYRLWKKYQALTNEYQQKVNRGGNKYAAQLANYRKNASAYYSKYKMHKSKQRKYARMAQRYLTGKPIFTANHRSKNKTDLNNYRSVKAEVFPILAEQSAITKPFILPIEKGQSLEDAIAQAMAPDAETLKKLTQTLKSASAVKKKKCRVYSKKRKRWITVWRNTRRRISFSKGLYIVQLGKGMNVISVRRVKSAYLNPHNYQNQQYLKNSYFGPRVAAKEL